LPATTEPRNTTAIMRRVVLALIAVSAFWTLVVATTGGSDLRPHGIPFRSTEADRPAALALVLIALYVAAFRRRLPADAAWLEDRVRPVAQFMERRAALLALALTAITFLLGMRYGVHVAGGSDSYGYISQAQLWLSRDLIVEQPLAAGAPWPDADWTLAPLGYRPARQAGAIVPVYAPGLPLLMALGTLLIGACGPYLVVPLTAAALVWLTYRLGAGIWSRGVGVTAAMVMATSPTLLFMTMNPMSDVPVSMFFTAALVVAVSQAKARAFWTGVVLSIGIAIRPNLVPIGAVYLGLLMARAAAGERLRTMIWFSLGGLPSVMVIAATNAVLYGAPWRAGYGNLAEMYGWGYGWPNVRQYTTWLLQTETPFILLAVVPLLALLRRAGGDRRVALAAVALVAGGVWLSYLFYTAFDAWWYLRFLLPAFSAMFVLASIGAALLIGRMAGGRRAAAAAMVLAVPFLAFRIDEVRNRGILEASIGGVVYLSASEYVRTRLPGNAIILTVQHSGSIRHNAGRLTLRWDLLSAEWWPRALAALVERGYRPYLLVSSFEERQLRTRFGFSDAPDAPGTLVAEMKMPEEIRLYDPLRQTAASAETIPAAPCCPCTLRCTP
jgi:hypothetical protein